jgi:hypothetical protein
MGAGSSSEEPHLPLPTRPATARPPPRSSSSAPPPPSSPPPQPVLHLEPLLSSCRLGDHTTTKRLVWQLKETGRLSAKELLDCAQESIRNDRHEVLAVLLAAGVDVDARLPGGAGTILFLAAKARASRCFRALVDAGCDVRRYTGWFTALHLCARIGYLTGVLVLLGSGRCDLSLATDCDDADLPLHIASRCGFVAIVRALLKAGADPNAVNADGETALHLASRLGHTAIVLDLLQAGADATRGDSDWVTPLHLACSAQVTAVARLLILARADPHRPDGSGTPAMMCGSRGFREMLRAVYEDDDGLLRCLKSGEFADVSLAGVAAHACILAARCPSLRDQVLSALRKKRVGGDGGDGRGARVVGGGDDDHDQDHDNDHDHDHDDHDEDYEDDSDDGSTTTASFSTSSSSSSSSSTPIPAEHEEPKRRPSRRRVGADGSALPAVGGLPSWVTKPVAFALLHYLYSDRLPFSVTNDPSAHLELLRVLGRLARRLAQPRLEAICGLLARHGCPGATHRPRGRPYLSSAPCAPLPASTIDADFATLAVGAGAPAPPEDQPSHDPVLLAVAEATSDVTLVHGSSALPMHRVFLSTGSAVFGESLADGSVAFTVPEEVDAEDLRMVLASLYARARAAQGRGVDVGNCVRMLKLAHTYRAQGLLSACETAIGQALDDKRAVSYTRAMDSYSHCMFLRTYITFQLALGCVAKGSKLPENLPQDIAEDALSLVPARWRAILSAGEELPSKPAKPRTRGATKAKKKKRVPAATGEVVPAPGKEPRLFTRVVDQLAIDRDRATRPKFFAEKGFI